MTAPEPFTHRIRVRYAEVDGQGVVRTGEYALTSSSVVPSW